MLLPGLLSQDTVEIFKSLQVNANQLIQYEVYVKIERMHLVPTRFYDGACCLKSPTPPPLDTTGTPPTP